MIKLLIAEDEHLERKAIKFYLNKFYADEIEIVAEVANGEEAIFQALENDVDLVLMDIQMPKINGLSAAEKLKEKSPEIEIIILTAHSEFDYARKSIQIGVNDYLVKPYVEDDFIEVMDKTLTKIKNKREAEGREKRLLKRLKNISPILEKEIILDIIYQTKASLDNFLEHKKLLGIEGTKYMFITINYENGNKVSDYFYQKIKALMKEDFEGVIAYRGLINSIFLIIDDDLDNKIKSAEYTKLYNLIDNHFESEKTKIEIIESKIVSDYHKLNELYNQTKKRVSDTEFSINNYPYQSEKKVFAKIIDKDIKLAKEEFKQIFDYLAKEEKAELKKIKSFLRRFLVFLNRRLMEYYDKQQAFLNMQKVEREITLINNLEDLKIYMDKIIQNLIEELSNNAKEQKVEIIDTVKEYIKENYSNDISLDDLADYIAFSKYYLSKLFKEVEGINYKDYLIKVRMEEAKKRLKNGDKIKVVACEVGYSDRNYFSRAFKKYTGISPGKYQ